MVSGLTSLRYYNGERGRGKPINMPISTEGSGMPTHDQRLGTQPKVSVQWGMVRSH